MAEEIVLMKGNEAIAHAAIRIVRQQKHGIW